MNIRSWALAFISLSFIASCAGKSGDATASTNQSVWSNGDFEDDADGAVPSGWNVVTHLNPNSGITDTRPTPQTLGTLSLGGGGTAMTYVVAGAPESQTDPDIGVGGTLRFPKYGQRAVRVNYQDSNSPGTGRNSNEINQTMTVSLGDVDPTDNKVHVRFALAPVLENPNHSYEQQPYYFVSLQDITKGTTVYQDFNASGQPGVPWKNFTDTFGQAAQYTDWQLVDISPGDAALAVGDTVQLTVIATGCAAGGHWGRVYVDAVGSGIPGLYTWSTGPQAANAGSDVTYTLSYKNGGTVTTAGTKLDFTTPPNTTFTSTTGASCTTPSVGGTGVVSCTLGSLSNGSTGSFAVTVSIPPSVPNGSLITNGTYSIYATGVSALIGPKVYTTVTNGAVYADVSVTNTDGVAAVGWGTETTYTLNVANAGPASTTATAVTDTAPAQLTDVSWTCTGTSCTTASGSGDLSDVIALPVGASVTYTITGTATGAGRATLINVATVDAGPGVTDPDTNSNSAVDTDGAGTLSTLTVTKSGSIGNGSISSTPASLSCDTGCMSSSASFLDSDQVVLTATPATGATFIGWTGACSDTTTTCTVTMNGAQSVVATFAGAPATTSMSDGSPQSTTVSTAFAAQLAVAVRDDDGAGVPGVTVVFSSPGSGASANGAASAITDSAGIARVTATANAIAGAYSVTASVAGITPAATFSLANIGSPATIVVSSGSGQSTVVATAFSQQLVALVRDSANQPVPGKAVTFSIPGTGASLQTNGGATTDASGLAHFSITANTIAGTYPVTASTTGPASPASFTLTNTAGTLASLTATAGSGQSTTISTPFATALVVHAADLYANAIAGRTIGFTPPPSGATATMAAGGLATTDSSGNATIVATAGTVAGSYSVSATSGAVTPASFTLTNTAGAAATIAKVDGDGQTAIVTHAFAAPLHVIVKDASGNPVASQIVTFGAPGTGASATLGAATATTDTNGIAAMTATANQIAGSDSITASIAAGATTTFGLVNAPSTASQIHIVPAASPQVITVTQPFTLPLAVVVADTYGNTVPSALVTYDVPTLGASAVLSTMTATTDSTGHAAVTASANTIAGTYVVHASVTGAVDAAAFTLTNSVGAPAALSVAGGGTQSAVVDTDFAHDLQVQIVDAHGNPVPGAVVDFTVPGFGATVALASSSAQTDSTGTATMHAHAGTVTGSYSVIAALPGVTTPVAFALTNSAGAPATIVASAASTPQSAQVHTAYQALVAIVTDVFGNLVPGATVGFAAPITGATGTIQASATTGSNGRASLGIMAGAVAGTFDVTATVTGVTTPATFTLTNLAGPAQTVTATSGGPQTTTVATAFPTALVALVRDSDSNPVPGVVVTFAAPPAGATATLAHTTVATGVDGTASTTITGGTVTGAYTVTATTPTGAAPATYALTNTAGAPATMTMASSSTPQTAQVSTAFAHPLAVVVTDQFGNVVPAAHVQFATKSLPGAVLSASSSTTDSTGTASVTAVADSKTGAFTVTASVDGAADTSFALANLAAGPSQLVISQGAAQHALATMAYATPVLIHVVDTYGNAVPQAPVTIDVPTTGATATVSDAMPTTDTSGNVMITLVAGATVGTFTIAAHAPGALTPATTTMTVDAIPTTTTLVSPAQITIDALADVTITVASAHGTPTGMITILGGDGATLGSAVLADGSATVKLPTFVAGSHQLVAHYDAQGSFAASASTAATISTTADSGSLDGGGCNTSGGNAGGMTLVLIVGLALVVRKRRLAIASLAVLSTVGIASAEPDGARALEQYHATSPDSAWFAVDSASFQGDRVVTLGISADYASQPLDIYNSDGTVRERIVTDSFMLQAGGSVTLADRFRLSANVPMAPWQQGNGGMYNGMALSSPEFAFGDITLSGDARLYGDPRGGFRLAAGVRALLPTGSRTNFTSDGEFGIEPHLLAGGTLGMVEYAGSVSALLRPENELAGQRFGDELRFACAVGARFDRLIVGPELFGAAPLARGLASGTPLELELGAHYVATSTLRIGAGVTRSLINAIGEPDWRTIASLTWSP